MSIALSVLNRILHITYQNLSQYFVNTIVYFREIVLIGFVVHEIKQCVVYFWAPGT